MRDHKSLVAWQVSNQVAREVLRLSRTRWRPSASALFHQLQRASLSVQLNIAEGYALYGSQRFRYHIRIAYGSAVETTELLELAAAERIIPPLESAPWSKAPIAPNGSCWACCTRSVSGAHRLAYMRTRESPAWALARMSRRSRPAWASTRTG